MNQRSRRSAVICDMDGTLVDVSSIRHYVLEALNPDGTFKKKKNFDAFHRESVNCPAILETLDEVRRWTELGHDVIVVTARNQKYYGVTAWWLAEHEVPHVALYMRPEGDFRSDYIVKKEILARIEQRWEVVHAIDDSPYVLQLWADEGIPTTVVPGWVETA